METNSGRLRRVRHVALRSSPRANTLTLSAVRWCITELLNWLDQVLFERLAEAQFMCEAPPAGGKPALRKRASSSGLIMEANHAAISAEQRAAIAELLDMEEPSLNERLSLHARLLLSEVLLVLRPDASSAAVFGLDAAAAKGCKLQGTMENAGIHVSARLAAFQLAAYTCQTCTRSVSVTAICIVRS